MKCCLCGKDFIGYGNNPWPLRENEDDRCCDECNDTKVIPARLQRLKTLQPNKECERYGKR